MTKCICRNGVLCLYSIGREDLIYASARLIEGESYNVLVPPYSEDLAIVQGPGLDDQLWSFKPVSLTEDHKKTSQ